MKILIFIDSSKASLSVISAAKQISNEVDAIVLGKDAENTAKNFQEYGLNKIFYSKVDNYVCESYAKVILSKLTDYQYFIVAANSIGKELAPYIAGKWQAGQASDIIAINSNGSFKRPVYAGNAFSDLKILTEKKVVTVRTSSFVIAQKSSPAQLEKIDFNQSSKVRFVSSEISKSERPELSSAEYVISGGRALGSKENFEKFIFPLADAMKAGIGASRAAVDSGYAPNDWQVGQTGKIVAPKVYIAAGISGAIQHLAGMKDSKTIIAINKDPDAPIFEVADYGLVADIFETLPKMTDAFKNNNN